MVLHTPSGAGQERGRRRSAYYCCWNVLCGMRNLTHSLILFTDELSSVWSRAGCGVGRYDYLEFKDSHGKTVKCDEKVGATSWPKVLKFPSCSRLQFTFRSDSSGVDWGYKFKVRFESQITSRSDCIHKRKYAFLVVIWSSGTETVQVTPLRKNSSIFSLIQMHKMPSARACGQ